MDILLSMQLVVTAAVGQAMAWAWSSDQPRAAAWLLRTIHRRQRR